MVNACIHLNFVSLIRKVYNDCSRIHPNQVASTGLSPLVKTVRKGNHNGNPCYQFTYLDFVKTMQHLNNCIKFLQKEEVDNLTIPTSVLFSC